MAGIGSPKGKVFRKDRAVDVLRVMAAKVANAVVQHTDTYKLFKRRKLKYNATGRYLETPIQTAAAQGLGARAVVYLWLKGLPFNPEQTARVYAEIKNGPGAAYVDWTSREMQSVLKSVAEDCDRQVMGVGTGIVAKCSTVAPDTGSGTLAGNKVPAASAGDPSKIYTVTLKDAFGVDGCINPARYFAINGRYRYGTVDGNLVLTSDTDQFVRVEDIDERKNQIKVWFEGAVKGGTTDSPLANMVFVRGDEADHAGVEAAAAGHRWTVDPAYAKPVDDPSGTKEMMGLLGMIDDGEVLQQYRGLDRKAVGNAFWRSLVHDVAPNPTDPATQATRKRLAPGAASQREDGGGLVTTMDFQWIMDQLRRKAKSKPDMMLGSPNAFRSYIVQEYENIRRTQPGSGQYTTGAKKDAMRIILGTTELTLQTSMAVPDDRIFILDSSDICRVQLRAVEWSEMTGSRWHQVHDTGMRGAHMAYGRMWANMFVEMPWKHAQIKGIADVEL